MFSSLHEEDWQVCYVNLLDRFIVGELVQSALGRLTWDQLTSLYNLCVLPPSGHRKSTHRRQNTLEPRRHMLHSYAYKRVLGAVKL